MFCYGKMKKSRTGYSNELDCNNSKCRKKYAYQAWICYDSDRISRVMFLCNNRDINIDFEYNETTILKEQDSDEILFTMPGAFQPTVKHDYAWLENKIKAYELMM